MREISTFIDSCYKCDKQPYLFTEKRRYLHKNELNSRSIGLVHQHDRRFFFLEHQYGCRDVTFKRSVANLVPRAYSAFKMADGRGEDAGLRR